MKTRLPPRKSHPRPNSRAYNSARVKYSTLFPPATFRDRRRRLSTDVGSGLILFLGNDEVGMNYTANVYPFRQDSSFLYFWDVDQPGLAALIDVDSGQETLFGDDVSLADVVWSGPQSSIADRAAQGAVAATAPAAALAEHLPRQCRRAGRFISSRRIAPNTR